MDHEAVLRELLREYETRPAALELLLDLEGNPRRLNHGRRDGPPTWWRLVKHGVYLLLWTDDPKYQAERKHLAGSLKPVVATLAGFLVQTLGLAQGIAVSYAALALILPLKISKGAWCAQMSTADNTEEELERAALQQMCGQRKGRKSVK